MLVLSRKKDEVVHIGENVRITVVEVRIDKVRIGIEAPTTVPVHRLEVYEAIQREHARVVITNVKDTDIEMGSDHIESAAVSAAHTCGPRLTSN